MTILHIYFAVCCVLAFSIYPAYCHFMPRIILLPLQKLLVFIASIFHFCRPANDKELFGETFIVAASFSSKLFSQKLDFYDRITDIFWGCLKSLQTTVNKVKREENVH